MNKNFSSCLRHRIIIEQPMVQEDGIGGRIEQWQEFAKVNAEVQALYEQRGQGEVFIAMQLIDNSFYRFRIRFMPELKRNMRIIYDERIFQIKRIINQGEIGIISIIMAQESL